MNDDWRVYVNGQQLTCAYVRNILTWYKMVTLVQILIIPLLIKIFFFLSFNKFHDSEIHVH